MNRTIFSPFIAAIFFVSCNNRIDDKLEQEIIRNLEQNNAMLDEAASKIFADFEKKSLKPETREKALFWLPTVNLVDTFLRKLNNILSKSEINKQSICLSYNNYVNEILNINPRAKEELKNFYSEVFLKEDCENINLKISREMCKNKAIVLRNIFIEWCLKQIGSTDGCGYDKFMAIASQNSTHFKPNEDIEIYAGIGAFNKTSQPTIKVDDETIPVNYDGVIEYKSNVGNRKGKFTKKIVIIFTLPDGRKETIEKEIKYTVD